MNLVKVNLACGDVFIDSDDWINFDFAPASSSVIKANLLDKLPLPDDGASLVYASHFFEHIPRDAIAGFLRECFRILAPGGSIRLVLPDFEEMASTYLKYRDAGEHEKADFLIVEIIDQAVRRRPGGELGDIYRQLRSQTGESVAEMRQFINGRNGEAFGGLINESKFALNSASMHACKQNIAGGAAAHHRYLDTGLPSITPQGVSRTERQPGRHWRAAPMALGLSPSHSYFARSRVYRCSEDGLRSDRNRRLSVASAGCMLRWFPAERRGVYVYRGAQARVNTIAASCISLGVHDE